MSGSRQHYSSLVFVPRIETVLAIKKLFFNKDMFGHSNGEFSYLCLLVYILWPCLLVFARTFLQELLVYLSDCLYNYYHIYLGCLGCELKLNGFFSDICWYTWSIHGTSCISVEVYLRIHNITRLFTTLYNITRLFTAICYKLMWFMLMAAQYGVYKQFAWSTDTCIPWFDHS